MRHWLYSLMGIVLLISLLMFGLFSAPTSDSQAVYQPVPANTIYTRYFESVDTLLTENYQLFSLTALRGEKITIVVYGLDEEVSTAVMLLDPLGSTVAEDFNVEKYPATVVVANAEENGIYPFVVSRTSVQTGMIRVMVFEGEPLDTNMTLLDTIDPFLPSRAYLVAGQKRSGDELVPLEMAIQSRPFVDAEPGAPLPAFFASRADRFTRPSLAERLNPVQFFQWVNDTGQNFYTVNIRALPETLPNEQEIVALGTPIPRLEQPLLPYDITLTVNPGGEPQRLERPVCSITYSLIGRTLVIQDTPGEAYRPLGQLNGGDNVEVIGTDDTGEWIQIVYADTPSGSGWVQNYDFFDTSAETCMRVVPVEENTADLNTAVEEFVETLPVVKPLAVVPSPSPTLIEDTPTFAPTVPANASLSMSVDPVEPTEGSTVTYSIRVNNNDSQPLSNVLISSSLPDGLTLISVNGCAGSSDGTSCNVGAVPSGGSAGYSILAQVNQGTAGQTITTSASASVGGKSLGASASITVKLPPTAIPVAEVFLPTETPTATLTPTATATSTPTATLDPCLFNIPASDEAALITAINTANNETICPGQNTITLTNSTYSLISFNNTTDGDNGLPSITTSIVIMGNNAIIERAGVVFRLFHVAASGSLTLNQVIVQGGNAVEGGAIYNLGSLNLSGSTVRNNSATDGGALYNLGTANINSSSVIGGSAGTLNTASSNGGGIFNNAGASLTIDGSAVSFNTAGSGGGIFNQGTTTIQGGSTIASNNAPSGGGVITFASLTITGNGTTVRSNSATSGGGIFIVDGSVSVTSGAVIGGVGGANTANSGGGIYNSSNAASPLTINGATVSYNTAAGSGGGINTITGATITSSFITNNTAVNDGGGIYSTASGNLTITGGGVQSNQAARGGGIWHGSNVTLSISGGAGISSNTATGAQGGGGIYVTLPGNVSFNTVTMINNTASAGAGIANNGFNFTFQNSVLGPNNTANCSAGGSASFTNNGVNSGGDTTCGGF